MGRNVAALSACAALALAFTGWATAASQQVPLERAVQRLTGRTYSVACLSQAEFGQARWAGLTELDSPPRIFLAPQTCDALLRRVGTDAFDRAFAVKTLTHEAGHALLITACEYKAESYAMANWQRLYRMLAHASPTPAQIAYVDATHNQLPLQYLSPGPFC